MEVCNKFIIHLTKVLLGALEKHPFCYVELIPASLQFSVFYCFTEAGQELAFEKFVIQCLNLIKSILLSTHYRPAKIIEGNKEQIFPRLNYIDLVLCRCNSHYRN